LTVGLAGRLSVYPPTPTPLVPPPRFVNPLPETITGAVIELSSLLAAGDGLANTTSSSSLESPNRELTKTGLAFCSELLPLLSFDKNRPLLLLLLWAILMSSLEELVRLARGGASSGFRGERSVFAKPVSDFGFMRLKLESEGVRSSGGMDIRPLAMSTEGETEAVDVVVAVWRRDMRIGLRSAEVGDEGGTEEVRFVAAEVVVGTEARGLVVVVVGGTDDVRRVLGMPFWRSGDLGTEDVNGVDRGIVVPGGFDGDTCFAAEDCVTTAAAATKAAVCGITAALVSDIACPETFFSWLTSGFQAFTKAFCTGTVCPAPASSPVTCVPAPASFFGVLRSFNSPKSSIASEYTLVPLAALSLLIRRTISGDDGGPTNSP